MESGDDGTNSDFSSAGWGRAKEGKKHTFSTCKHKNALQENGLITAQGFGSKKRRGVNGMICRR